ncbi:MAG: hypothetical protein Q7K44_00275 [Candidatus Liptonbacteria bacterium]|nr:hypothetical protein [Candidatus Liptonbacteria bacterium]
MKIGDMQMKIEESVDSMVCNVLRMVEQCCGNLVASSSRIPINSPIHLIKEQGVFRMGSTCLIIIRSANSEQGGPVTEKAEYDDIVVEVLSGRFFKRAKKFCIVYERESNKQATLIKKF